MGSKRPRASVLLQLAVLGLASLPLFTTGCSGGGGTMSTGPQPIALQGQVHGGRQPVSGATIQLYAVTSGGYGAPATALIGSPVTTGPLGNFNITGAYTCSSGTMVYLVATGGDPGVGSPNPALAMMTALGDCGNLTASTFIFVNEVTTVASVYALAQFMGVDSAGTAMGTSATNSVGLTNAFATVNNLVDTTTGKAPGPTLSPGATVPRAELNTLADMLANCVNSDGTGSPCSMLFAATTPSFGPDSGTAPTNTIDAALNMALYPDDQVAARYALVTGTPPFLPTLSSQPNDWTVAVSYTGNGMFSPLFLAIDGSGSVWVACNNNVSIFSNAGVPAAISPALISGIRGIAMDASGNAWVTVYGSGFSSSVVRLQPDATTDTFPLDPSAIGPVALAIDTSGNVWVTGDSGTLSELDSSGALQFTSAVGAGGLSNPTAIAVDGSGNIWVSNGTINAGVSEFGPTGTPAAVAGFTGGGAISTAYGVAIDSASHAWVADHSGEFIPINTSDGSLFGSVHTYALQGTEFGIAVDGDNNIWSQNFNNASNPAIPDNNVIEYSSSLGMFRSPTPPTTATGYQASGTLSNPAGLAIDSSGNVWVTNIGTDSLSEIVGVAAPTRTPLVSALPGSIGTRP